MMGIPVSPAQSDDGKVADAPAAPKKTAKQAPPAAPKKTAKQAPPAVPKKPAKQAPPPVPKKTAGQAGPGPKKTAGQAGPAPKKTAEQAPPAPPGDESATIAAIRGPVPEGWREGTLTRAKELEALSLWVWLNGRQENAAVVTNDEVLRNAIPVHLKAARQAALGQRPKPRKRFRFFHYGPRIERARSNLDAAEAHILTLAPYDYILGQMPCLLNHVQRHLPPNDARRQEFERIARRVGIADPNNPLVQKEKGSNSDEHEAVIKEERRKIVNIVRAASSAALREHVRLGSFRNVVVITAMLMAVLAIGVALTGFFRPTLIPMCFAPQEAGKVTVVCPTAQSEPFVPKGQPAQKGVPTRDTDMVIQETAKPTDLIVIELVGLTAAAIATAAAIRNIKGSSERYGLPVSLAALKLPTGAITAFLGLLLMRGQFVPGLSALDTPAQILAWALVFGYAQQLFTRLVDQQGQTILDNVRGADKPQPVAVQP